MKFPVRYLLAALALSWILNLFSAIAFAQGTAFTYQGRLDASGAPANGAYDFEFTLYPTNNGGSAVAGSLTNAAVQVSNGLFVATLDFGTGVFTGSGYWLQIGVRTNGGGAFIALLPREELTPAPYAIFAEGANAAGLSGTITGANLGGTYSSTVNFNNGANNFDGTFSGMFYGSSFIGGDFVGDFIGSGDGLTDVWHMTGNSGTTAGSNFLGTSDFQPLELHVNGVRAFRLEPTYNTGFASGAVNVIGGSSVNYAAPGTLGVTIAGGGAPYYFGAGTANRTADNVTTIGGGMNNDIQTNSYESTIGGGNANSILPGSWRSTISGGFANTIGTNSFESFIGGGAVNVIQTNCGESAICGGYGNTIAATSGVGFIGGGSENCVAAPYAVIGGGFLQTNSGYGSFLGAGYLNDIQTNNYYCFIGAGYQNQIQTGANYGGILAGGNNVVGATFGVIAGGSFQSNSGYASFIGDGYQNSIQANSAFGMIGGGYLNQIQTNGSYAAILGGADNSIQASYATIAGGSFNTNQSQEACIAGGFNNVIQTNAGDACIGGGTGNLIEGFAGYAAIGGGYQNIIQTNNQASTIGGGYQNIIQSSGFGNAVVGHTIAGGTQNIIQSNTLYSTIGGGYFNTNGGNYATIPGGVGNFVGGYYSFAAGHMAKAPYQGDFVWADSQNTNFSATTSDQVSFRCQGGVVFTSGSSAANQTVSWAPGAAGWSFSSDRNLKDHFEKVDAGSVLDRLAQLPILEWNYRGYTQRHIGPMAQDFHALFPLNANDRMLNDADLHGVELAAIQGLNQKLDDKDKIIRRQTDVIEHQTAEIEDLNVRLEKLEQLARYGKLK